MPVEAAQVLTPLGPCREEGGAPDPMAATVLCSVHSLIYFVDCLGERKCGGELAPDASERQNLRQSGAGFLLSSTFRKSLLSRN